MTDSIGSAEYQKNKHYGEVWTNGGGMMFLFDKLVGGMIKTINFSNTLFLLFGKKSGYEAVYLFCWKATDEEIVRYKRIIKESKYSRTILQIIEKKGIKL